MSKKIDIAEQQIPQKHVFSYGVGEGTLRFPIWANNALREVDSFVSGIWLWGTCKGRLGEPDGELSWALTGEPRGATAWSQLYNKNKNPCKQSLVTAKRKRKNTYIIYIYIYVCVL